MAVPRIAQLIHPSLEVVSKNNEINLAGIVEQVADKLELSKEDQQKKVASGRELSLNLRVSWALTYLVKALLIERPRPGYHTITDRGIKALAEGKEVNEKFLEGYEEFKDFKNLWGRKKKTKSTVTSEQNSTTISVDPTDNILELHNLINTKLADELLDLILKNPPEFFEQLIVDLMQQMNYGGEQENSGEVLGKSGDEGIDGVINQDKLGVEKIYMQAKRYAPENSVGAKDIRDFSGALSQKQSKKGIFFTTSSFSQSAEKAAKESGSIVLIDGQRLTELMIEYNLGCIVEQKLYIKRVDKGYFLVEASD